jgi:hypothetical protein
MRSMRERGLEITVTVYFNISCKTRVFWDLFQSGMLIRFRIIVYLGHGL